MAEARLRPDAFDAFAEDYDSGFAHSAAARLLRGVVWRCLQPHLSSGARVLDLGCGSGEDSLWMARAGCEVVSADASPAMLDAAWRKALRAGVDDRVETRLFDLNAPQRIEGQFDLVLSNFGAVNCALDLAPLGAVLADMVAPGGVVAIVAMGRFCAWESLWYGFHAKRTAFRRWTGRSVAKVGDGTIPIRYWRPQEIVQALGSAFTLEAVHPVGLFLPPSDLFSMIERRPRLFRRLAGWEALAFSRPGLARLADHHLTLLRRKGASS